MKTSTKYWIYALVINPITTLIIYYMFNAGFNLLNLIGVGIIGYGIFLYFVVQAIRIDVRADVYKRQMMAFASERAASINSSSGTARFASPH